VGAGSLLNPKPSQIAVDLENYLLDSLVNSAGVH
jgi:hypothetical protein